MTQDGMPKKDDNQKSNPQILQKIEQLQNDLDKNPRSLSFPQLADLYLTQNMEDEAFDLLQKGLKYHPNSVSGMLVLARILKSRSHLNEAEAQLTKAIKLAPQNWQAYLLRADLYVKLERHKQALSDFKKVLLFNETHPVARKAVAKLEMLTADLGGEAEQNFSINSLQTIEAQVNNASNATLSTDKSKSSIKLIETPAQLERVLSLIDAFSLRQEYAKALKLLYECKNEYGSHPEIEERMLKLSQFETAEKIRPKNESKMSESRKALIIQKKQKALELLLRRINEMSHTPLVPD